MDRINLKEKAIPFIKKYRYVLLILALGLILMCLPERAEKTDPGDSVMAVETIPDMEQRLEAILSQIQGAGKVKVLLTESTGERTVYQTDAGSDGTSRDTVIITDTERAQQGLVSQINPPVYQGAVIVCQGGDDPAVRLAIVEAVSDATGLGADRITVLKMK